MNISIAWCLDHINQASKLITHEGQYIPKDKLRLILSNGLSNGHETIKEISDADVEGVLNNDTSAGN